MLWSEKRDRLCFYIRAISRHLGGEGDDSALREYCRSVIQVYHKDIDTALACFKSVAESLCIVVTFGRKAAFKSSFCESCGYVPPFCNC